MRIQELAEKVSGEVIGNSDGEIHAVGGLHEAVAGQISFLSNPKYRKLLHSTSASAVLVSRDWDEPTDVTLIKVENPDAAFAEVCKIFCPPPIRYQPGIDPTSVISDHATLGKNLHIGPHVVIEKGAVIGDDCVLLSGVLISENARLGAGSLLHAGAVLRENVIVGDRVILHNHVVIGSDGFGYTVEKDGSRTKVPQVGIVRLGDDVEIGAHTCVDRARFGETLIGNRVKIDNLVQIAHNVVIEDDVVLVSQVGISGSTVVKQKAILAGQVGVAGHLTIGANSVVGAQGGVTKDVPPATYVWGTPATDFKKYSKTLSNINRLGKLQDRVAALEAKLADGDKD
ncbi:UDP-3-O-(3-hydroxymyristoyl)glucosamine N-acyltransferase [Kiritimatiellota bacterium B12222]|nr:UDP-3-O-(3-hydroxymyristoyl)glucosamine N-acyltransferase [Kiritimatiellota bacterium B12222]